MGKLRFNITMSLDGFVAGPTRARRTRSASAARSCTSGRSHLHAWREPHGREGGEVNASTPVVEERLENVGATIMGRNMFGGGPGPWGDGPLERLVGRRPAVPHAGLRPHPPRA